MFGRGRTEASEDSSVAGVEAALGLAAGSASSPSHAPGDAPIVTHALWICACVTFDEAPTWLIYGGDRGVSWCRVPDGVEPLDLVHAQSSAGGHADPTEVLRWLEGKARDPWASGGSGSGDVAVVVELGRRIRDELAAK